MKWSKMKWAGCILSEGAYVCEKLGALIEYKASCSLTPYGSPTQAVIERYRGVRRDDIGVVVDRAVVYKVGIVRSGLPSRFEVYDLRDSSLAEAKRFAEAMVRAS